MRTEQLQYVLKVAQTGSMRIAADKLFVTQPALSNGIRQLEKELGYPLFSRAHNGTTLTEEGKRALPLIAQALDALSALPRLKTADTPLDPEAAGQLKILTVHSQNIAAIPALIRYFKFHWPKCSFFVFEKSSSEVLDGLLYENYDLGLISLHDRQFEPLQLPDDITAVLFDREQAYIRVQNTSVLATEKEVTIEQLRTFPLVVPNSSADDAFTLSKFFGSTVPQNIVLQTNNAALLETYCRENDCAMFGYQFMQSPEEYANSSYKFIPIKDVLTSFYAVYNKNNPRLAWIQHFIQTLVNYYGFSAESSS